MEAFKGPSQITSKIVIDLEQINLLTHLECKIHI
jgi:hypothetical protein